jgi:hypothetical protein
LASTALNVKGGLLIWDVHEAGERSCIAMVVANLLKTALVNVFNMDEETINKVIEMFKNSHQTLVWLDSICCPVRKVAGESHRDQEMHDLVQILKERNIIKDAGGFMSLMERPPYVYIDTVTLTDDFFNKHKKPEYKQMILF